MDDSRRSFLGTAAFGVRGLIMFSSAASAAEETDEGEAGAGGFGLKVWELPAGAPVAAHDPDDIKSMPALSPSPDGSRPKITSGGRAEEATERQLPIMKDLASAHILLDPGALRELHWHAIATEWACVIGGRCQTVVLDPRGETEINNYGPGDLWFFPTRHGHSTQTIGDEPCHFILSFDNGSFSEHGTFSITDWIDVTPKQMLGTNFDIALALLHVVPKGDRPPPRYRAA